MGLVVMQTPIVYKGEDYFFSFNLVKDGNMMFGSTVLRGSTLERNLNLQEITEILRQLMKADGLNVLFFQKLERKNLELKS